MILYHGTNVIFDEIDLAKSKPNKDFGQGFYLSREYSQAMDMAKIKVEQLESGTPTISTTATMPAVSLRTIMTSSSVPLQMIVSVYSFGNMRTKA